MVGFRESPRVVEVVGQIDSALALVLADQPLRDCLHVNMDRFVRRKEGAPGSMVYRGNCQERVRSKTVTAAVKLSIGRHPSYVLLTGGRADIDLNVEVVVDDIPEQPQVQAAGDRHGQ